MIIDSHTHFGTMDKFNMPAKLLLKSMEKYKIDYSIVSNIESTEFTCELEPIPKKFPSRQLAANEKTLSLLKKYPAINFVMVHMGLGTDNKKAIDYIAQLDNLYGDTSWVSLESTLRAVEKCGSHKILFGTDSPIDGIDTYEKYLELIEGLRKKLPTKDFENLMFHNAIKLFKLEL